MLINSARVCDDSTTTTITTRALVYIYSSVLCTTRLNRPVQDSVGCRTESWRKRILRGGGGSEDQSLNLWRASRQARPFDTIIEIYIYNEYFKTMLNTIRSYSDPPSHVDDGIFLRPAIDQGGGV